MIGGKKVEKFQKSKYDRFEEYIEPPKKKPKHHDKSYYRLAKEDEYEFGYRTAKANKRN